MTTGQDQILSAVHRTLKASLSAPTHVCVGLSGGLDSVVLLHALTQLRDEVPFKLSALHVQHGLSPNAEKWVSFCQSLCASLNVACTVVHLSLPNTVGKGTERVAREARYLAFAQVPADILCLAHHQNDRAETLLLNLFRGAGVVGLAGLPEARLLDGKRLMRPFIDTPRADLQAWASAHQLSWIEDESNADLAFRRNYVRHRVIPAITEIFPGVVGVLARTSARMAEQATLLDRLAESDGQACRDATGHLSVTRLQALPEPVVRNILRHAFFQAGIRVPTARRLETFSAQLMSARVDSEVFVRMGEVGLHLWRDQIWIDRAIARSCPPPLTVETGVFAWPDGELVIHDASNRDADLRVAPLGYGQHFQPQGRCRDNVSELLRARGVPPWVRPRLPALYLNGDLIWIAELGWADSVIADMPNEPTNNTTNDTTKKLSKNWCAIDWQGEPSSVL